MIRQPPAYVPAAIAVPEHTITHSGTWVWWALSVPLATSASVITPIVFCASLDPWASASAALETISPARKPRATRPGLRRPSTR